MSKNKSASNIAFPSFPRDVEVKAKSNVVVEQETSIEAIVDELPPKELPRSFFKEETNFAELSQEQKNNPEISLPSNLYLNLLDQNQNILVEEAINKVTNEICQNLSTLKLLAKLIADELVSKLDVHQQLSFIKKYSNQDVDVHKLELKQALENFAETMSQAFTTNIKNMVHTISNQSNRSN